jgi:hypothetical protein
MRREWPLRMPMRFRVYGSRPVRPRGPREECSGGDGRVIYDALSSRANEEPITSRWYSMAILVLSLPSIPRSSWLWVAQLAPRGRVTPFNFLILMISRAIESWWSKTLARSPTWTRQTTRNVNMFKVKQLGTNLPFRLPPPLQVELPGCNFSPRGWYRHPVNFLALPLNPPHRIQPLETIGQ